ncbi:mediator of RNA polymerase II transcription subunit 15-like [Haliotis rufescens]|uniref:mediator of RNA polymerase II transcription subunit 15-like n=1 Tax=Haliotis rufescens TaxID=6454 RepID=UPI00201EB52C|nr:mediator of RNA polymerase II transcription subunit 15-like [Haliotis rufescens]XP_046379209.2 mediator of RNA polymerase II transcription subunit 15-like [Haliotis rufescens]XP_046379210.2 mediator of RNA polymerase II transcription subunit 15-like [Haliotis rufescens]XP_046379211.2 mediator of RNA polymerase II transcription subunit 15-like [Haliotis rufescens]XP_046379212.2 mediator of RNA polymerase II transcription subunit 15-like [Haliotis rufescens]XP_046379213.2 mediator of RNA poly
MALQANSFADTMLRERVVAQIEAARQGADLEPGANSSEEMENVLYCNAKTRDDYMQLIASLVLHLNEKKRAAHRARSSAPQEVGGQTNEGSSSDGASAS